MRRTADFATGTAHHASFPEAMSRISAVEAAQYAQEAGAGALVLTHIPPYMDAQAALAAAKEHFAGPVELAVPGMRL